MNDRIRQWVKRWLGYCEDCASQVQLNARLAVVRDMQKEIAELKKPVEHPRLRAGVRQLPQDWDAVQRQTMEKFEEAV